MRRRARTQHFVMLGGLGYDRATVFDLPGRRTMIPLKSFKESSFYQLICEESRQRCRELEQFPNVMAPRQQVAEFASRQ
jgi:hypothetical protein